MRAWTLHIHVESTPEGIIAATAFKAVQTFAGSQFCSSQLQKLWLVNTWCQGRRLSRLFFDRKSLAMEVERYGKQLLSVYSWFCCVSVSVDVAMLQFCPKWHQAQATCRQSSYLLRQIVASILCLESQPTVSLKI